MSVEARVPEAEKAQPSVSRAAAAAHAQAPQQSRRLIDALDDLARSQRAWMLATARRYVRDAALAEDCVQDALLAAYRRLDAFEGRSSMRTWLHRIIVNASLMHLRRQRRGDELPVDDEALETLIGEAETAAVFDPSHGADALSTMARRQMQIAVRRTIDQLPPTHRTILHHRDLLQRSTAETAAILGITEEAVKVRLHRARAALRRSIDPTLVREL